MNNGKRDPVSSTSHHPKPLPRATRTHVTMDGLTHMQTKDAMLKNAAGFAEDDDIVSPVSGSRRTAYDIDGIVEMDEDAEERKGSRWKMVSFGRKGRTRRSSSTAEFKVYKRRWIGLVQIVLLNIVVSWDVSSFPS